MRTDAQQHSNKKLGVGCGVGWMGDNIPELFVVLERVDDALRVDTPHVKSVHVV